MATLSIMEVPKPPSILFISAFKDLGRGEWKGFERSVDKYCGWFKNLIQNPIRVVLFAEEDIRKKLQDEVGFRHSLPYEEEKTFLGSHLAKEREILQSAKHQNLILHRKDNPECWSAEYNLVNHNKVLFVQRAKALYPGYTHYAWIDFGYTRSEADVCEDFDWSSLTDLNTILYVSHREIRPEDFTMTPLETCFYAPDPFQGSMFICPSNLVDWYAETYRKMLDTFHSQWLGDDDQALLYHIYKAHPHNFSFYTCRDWFKLLATYSCKRKVDVIVPTCAKDLDTVNEVISRCRRFIQDVGTIYCLCPRDVAFHVKGADVVIDEATFPFTKSQVADLIESKIVSVHRKVGWFYQQLLKLYAHRVIPGLRSAHMIVDSETLFYNPISFFHKNNALYCITNEVSEEYRRHAHRMLPAMQFFHPQIGGVCHQMLFQRHVLEDMFDRASKQYKSETGHDEPMWRIMLLRALQAENGLGIEEYSEYEMYFNYTIYYYAYGTKIANFPWDVSTTIPETSHLVYLTAHAHLRNFPFFTPGQFRVNLA